MDPKSPQEDVTDAVEVEDIRLQNILALQSATVAAVLVGFYGVFRRLKKLERLTQLTPVTIINSTRDE